MNSRELAYQDVDNYNTFTIDKDGDKCYYDKDHKLHRTDGPAVEWHDGTNEYWIHGREYTEEEFCELIKKKK